MIKSFFEKVTRGLVKTRTQLTDRLDLLLNQYGEIDEELLEEIEDILISADLGMTTTLRMIQDLREALVEKKINDASRVLEVLKEVMMQHLSLEATDRLAYDQRPQMLLIIGVNGVGKTTTIGKLAHKFKSGGQSVLLVAGDTFRAAAIDQLKTWGERVGVETIAQQAGSDPASVIFDGISAAKARNTDVLICDTAGRLHNKKNLVMELGKIFKVARREYPEAKLEVLLVLDATTGQNAIAQAKAFKEVADITGIVLTKLDGSAKGGIIFAVKDEVGIPVKLVGLGEGLDDLEDFDGAAFVNALLG
ncbi:MAG: signal recognition particle-docking protein FtsY [delta proteobacterium ML8_F1]|nr:MAG: signal recognition particle-docking protein FtsY [delta proteobacterium ML8_F1]